MNQAEIQHLISRFNAQQISPEELKQLEDLIESGQVDLDALENLHVLQDSISRMNFPEPSSALDDRFYQELSLQKGERSSFSWSSFFAWPRLAPKIAMAAIALFFGIAIGYLMQPAPATSGNIEALSAQVSNLQEMMMLSLLEKESAAERLKAVSLTSQMQGVSAKVTAALLQTLNNDENVNVRLAALEALIPYAGDSQVREELIRSIAKQDSPLVQVALAELMEKIQARSSVDELRKIIQSEKTPVEVKDRVRESIKTLS